MRRALAMAILALGLIAAEPAPEPDRPLATAAQEARAQALFDDVRCVVCQHESIADSPAGIAADMRRLVREEIAAGRTDAEVRQGLVGRYGDYILFRPPVRAGTWLLWFGPLLVVIAGAASLWAMGRRRPTETPPLSPEEERRLAEVLRSDDLRRDPDATAPHDWR